VVFDEVAGERRDAAFVPACFETPDSERLRVAELRLETPAVEVLERLAAEERTPLAVAPLPARVRFVRVVFRVVAMLAAVARSMPSRTHGRCSRHVDRDRRRSRAARGGDGRTRRAPPGAARVEESRA
jgi:hypothetical protein